MSFPDATSFFPVVNWDLWEETEREEYPADEKNPLPLHLHHLRAQK